MPSELAAGDREEAKVWHVGVLRKLGEDVGVGLGEEPRCLVPGVSTASEIRPRLSFLSF
jgi:hypothetical protein